MCIVCGGLLVIQARVAVVLAVELVHRPQQDVQASISDAVLCSESLTQSITLAAGACELLFKRSVPHHPAQTPVLEQAVCSMLLLTCEVCTESCLGNFLCNSIGVQSDEHLELHAVHLCLMLRAA